MSGMGLFTGAHPAGARIQRLIVGAGPARALVIGPAGSGKSEVLSELREGLADRKQSVRVLDPELDIAAVQPEHVLIVDDLHLLDQDRSTQIRQRAADPGAGLIVGLRPWPRSHNLREIERSLQQSAPPIILGQVSRAEVLAYLDSEEDSIPTRCVDELIELTGGAAWMMTFALANGHVADCNGGDQHQDLRRDLENQVLERLDSLDPPLRLMIENLSLGTEATSTDDLVLQGYAEGLLERSGQPLPAVRAAIRTSVSQHWKVAHSDALAEGIARAVIDGDTSYEDLVSGVWDPQLGEVLATRADQLLERDPQRAADLYDTALAAGAEPSAIALSRARAAWATGHLDDAAGLVDQALQDARHRNSPELRDIAAAVWADRDMMAMASEVYESSPEPESGSTAIRARIARIGSGRSDSPDGREEESAGASVPSTFDVAMRLLDRGLIASLGGPPYGAALSDLMRASELYTASGAVYPIPEVPAVIAASVALGTGDLASTRQVLDAAVEGRQGGIPARRRLLLWQAMVAIQSERPADARAAVATAEQEPSPVSPRDARLTRILQVTLARRFEDLPALEAAWLDTRGPLSPPDVDLFTLFPLATLLGGAARLGDSVTLAPHLRSGLELLQRLGSPPVWSAHLWWAGIQQGILLNQPDSLAPFAKALVRAAERSPLASAMARAGSVWVAVLAGTVDAEAVEDAARTLGALGLAWDGGRLAAHAARRTRDRRVATKLLACARDLHPKETGAAPVTESAGNSRLGNSAAATLSDREFDVARLVVSGKTYVEIGEALFISPRTVEHHVAHMRRRLDATSRSDLIAKLRLAIDPSDHPDEPVPADPPKIPSAESPSRQVRV